MTREEFKSHVQRYLPKADFVKRYKSTRPSHPWSNRGTGWVLVQMGEFSPMLYDSIQNTEAYQSKCPTACWVIGRHTGEEFESLIEDHPGAWSPILAYLGYREFGEL